MAPFPDNPCWLEVKGTKWQYPLPKDRYTYIGRGDSNDIRLNSQHFEFRQAIIYWQEGRFRINNLSTRAPTKVNGRAIKSQNLGDGNTIQFGNVRMIFRDCSKRQRSFQQFK